MYMYTRNMQRNNNNNIILYPGLTQSIELSCKTYTCSFNYSSFLDVAIYLLYNITIKNYQYIQIFQLLAKLIMFKEWGCLVEVRKRYLKKIFSFQFTQARPYICLY